MRVSIDAIPLLLRSAGVKTYVYHWTRSLRRLLDGDQALDLDFCFPTDPAGGRFDHETSILGRWPTLARLALLHAANYSPVPILDRSGPSLDLFHASHQLLAPAAEYAPHRDALRHDLLAAAGNAHGRQRRDGQAIRAACPRCAPTA